MSINPIRQLPELEDHQDWACEHGCADIEPKLFKNIYVQRWDAAGNLVEQKAEHYYTCQHDHLLELYDTEKDEYVTLPDSAYQERQNIHNFSLKDIKGLRSILRDAALGNFKIGDAVSDFFTLAKVSIEVTLKDGSVLTIDDPYLDELEALYDQESTLSE